MVAWLLAADEPSVRYASLTGLLGEQPDGPAARPARHTLMLEGAVPRILAAQGEDGHWQSHDLARESKPGWRRFGFPLTYQTDVLEILSIPAKLGLSGDGRAREARDLVASKADAPGRWKLERTFNGKYVVDIETRGEPSCWVTLRALQTPTA